MHIRNKTIMEDASFKWQVCHFMILEILVGKPKLFEICMLVYPSLEVFKFVGNS